MQNERGGSGILQFAFFNLQSELIRAKLTAEHKDRQGDGETRREEEGRGLKIEDRFPLFHYSNTPPLQQERS
jgi:hypothetical protein